MFNWIIYLVGTFLISLIGVQTTSTQFFYIPTETTVSSSLVVITKQPTWSKFLVLKKDHPSWPKVSARGAAVVDWKTGQILWQKNPDKVLPLASLSKLMTALVVLQQKYNFNDSVYVPDKAIFSGIKSYLQGGENFLLADMFKIMLIASSNEAAESLARFKNRDDFINLMNQTSLDLGLTEAKFFGPSGLEPNNVATVSNLIKLSKVIFSKDIVQKESGQSSGIIKAQKTGREVSFENTNLLMNEKDLKVIAGKTGTLSEAGFSVMSVISKESKPPLLVIIVGADNHFARFEEAKKIAEWAWQSYVW